MMLTSSAASRTAAIAATAQRQAIRSLASDASLKAAPATEAQKERIKYFKVYRWDPEQSQKPYLVRSSTF